MAWTAVSEQSATWTAEIAATRVFDPAVFDTGTFNGLQIFDVGSPAGIWSGDPVPATTWTPHGS